MSQPSDKAKGKRKRESLDDDVSDSKPSPSDTSQSEVNQTSEKHPFPIVQSTPSCPPPSHPHPSYMPEGIGRETRIILDGRFAEVLSYPLTHIHFVALPPSKDQGDDKTPSNCWKLLLQTGHHPTKGRPPYRALLLEVPRDENGIGLLTINSKQYQRDTSDQEQYPNTWVHGVTCALEQPSTVSTLTSAIIEVFYSAYLYPADGEGTRFWHWVVAELFANKGLISMSDMRKVHQAVERYWKSPKGSGSEPQELAVGAFINEEEYGYFRGSIGFSVFENPP